MEFNKHFEADSWQEYNRKFFDQLAPKYDFLNHVISFGGHDAFKRRAFARIALCSNAQVLDLCTGSGDAAIALARRDPSIHVEAVDASGEMLKLAAIKAGKAGVHGQITFRQGDVTRLPYQDNAFDVVLISFGLRNLFDIPAAVKEFHRVTKPGGVFVNIDLGKPSGAWRTFLYKAYFRTLMPFLGKHVFHRGEFNSFQYLSSSNELFPPPQQLVSIFSSAGFGNPEIHSYMLGGVSQQIVRKVWR